MIQMIETCTGTAYQIEARGVSYHLCTIAGRWCVLSARNSAPGFGQARYFDSLAQVETAIKAFAGLSALTAVAA
jgi:hypothetical protein